MTPLERALDHTFASPERLQVALTHRSFANEHQVEHNERLEFLGDAILQGCMTTLLLERFPKAPEGQLSRHRASLVNTVTLAEVARGLDLGRHLRLGRGEDHSGGRDKDSLLADALEAVLGALFQEVGFDATKVVVANLFEASLEALDDAVARQGARATQHPKGALQELTQGRWRVTPRYRVVAEDGPPHERVFTVEVCADDHLRAQGQGPSKQAAERAAAEEALRALQP